MRSFGIEIELLDIDLVTFSKTFRLPFTNCCITDFSQCTMEGQRFPNGSRRHIPGCVGCGTDMKVYWHIIREAAYADCLLFEVISPILNDFNQIKHLCNVLRLSGAVVDPNRGGLHVHIDATGMSDRQLIGIFEKYKRNECEIDKMVAERRRGDIGCVCARSLKHMDFASVTTSSELCNLFNDKFYKVNALSLKKYGTLEFRQHEATIDFPEITKWVSFIQSICE